MKPTTKHESGSGLKFAQVLCVLFFFFGVAMFLTGNGGFLPMLAGIIGVVTVKIMGWWSN
jgi:hypothetical protein